MEKRRQLKTRSNPLAIRLAKNIADRNITPNQISLLSIPFGLLAMLALMFWNIFEIKWLQIPLLLIAIIGIQGRLLCNLLDGMVAVEGGKKTPDGEIYNDAPDRVTDILIFIGLGLGLSLPFSTALGISAALFAVLTAYVRMLGLSMGTPAYFVGPLAKQHRMALLTFAIILAIIGLFYGKAELILYIALIIINIGAILTCFHRLLKIRFFVMDRAAAINNIDDTNTDTDKMNSNDDSDINNQLKGDVLDDDNLNDDIENSTDENPKDPNHG